MPPTQTLKKKPDHAPSRYQRNARRPRMEDGRSKRRGMQVKVSPVASKTQAARDTAHSLHNRIVRRAPPDKYRRKHILLSVVSKKIGRPESKPDFAACFEAELAQIVESYTGDKRKFLQNFVVIRRRLVDKLKIFLEPAIPSPFQDIELRGQIISKLIAPALKNYSNKMQLFSSLNDPRKSENVQNLHRAHVSKIKGFE